MGSPPGRRFRRGGRSPLELQGVPGPSDYGFSEDGRTMVINYAAQESDIWLLTLQ